MKTAIKPVVTQRVDFDLPRGVVDNDEQYDFETSSYVKPYESNDAAIKAGAINWCPEQYGTAVIKDKKGRKLFLIGEESESYYDKLDESNAYVKITTPVAKKLIERALKSEKGSTAVLTDAEKKNAEFPVREKSPRFERSTGRADLFIFTAPCGDTSVLRRKTMENLLEVIKFAERELK